MKPTQNPFLENLADIHLPETVSYWPPAPGWWILFCICLAGLFFLYRFIRSKLQTHGYQQALLNELQQINRHWQKHNNIVLTAANLSTLLRRYCIDQYGRDSAAGSHSQNWSDYLVQHITAVDWNDKNQQIILELPYQDPLIQFDVEEHKVISGEINRLLSKIKIIFKQSKKPPRIVDV